MADASSSNRHFLQADTVLTGQQGNLALGRAFPVWLAYPLTDRQNGLTSGYLLEAFSPKFVVGSDGVEFPVLGEYFALRGILPALKAASNSVGSPARAWVEGNTCDNVR